MQRVIRVIRVIGVIRDIRVIRAIRVNLRVFSDRTVLGLLSRLSGLTGLSYE